MLDLTFARQLQLESHYPYVDITTKNDFLQELFTNLVEESSKDDALSSKAIQSGISYLYAVLARIANDNGPHYPAPNPTIDTFRILVYENHTPHKVEDYARKMNLPEDTFNILLKHPPESPPSNISST